MLIKDDSTALARQLLRLGSTRFHYSEDQDRGYIDSLDFVVNRAPLQPGKIIQNGSML